MAAFTAAEAARKQGTQAFDMYHLGLLKARWEDKLDFSDTQALIDLAGKLGLDTTQFKRDISNANSFSKVARDHSIAVEEYGVFGTPTFVFENKQAMYLKVVSVPEEEALSAYETLISLMNNKSFLGEMKRPQPPWPQAAMRRN